MLRDQIWKQQLTLVTYGNAYLQQNLDFSHWLSHSIFDHHLLQFRDLNTQQLLAQHFKIWLEGLKKQGVQRLSLHSSAILDDEQNPNPNVELLAYAHFIVSHSAQQKHAWICGRELPLWDLDEQNFQPPATQKITLQQDLFWRFELDKKRIKRLENDLIAAKWDEIQTYLNTSLFHHPMLQDCAAPTALNTPYTGQADIEESGLALIPNDRSAAYIHQTLHRFDGLKDFMQYKIQHPYAENGEILSPEQQQELRTLSQKIDEFHSKFIVKTANHYQTAQINISTQEQPDVDLPIPPKVTPTSTPPTTTKNHHFGVFKLMLMIMLICAVAYYFGL
jgi:hypothetical protein